MAISPSSNSPSCLDLTISVPGFASSSASSSSPLSLIPSSEGGGSCSMKNLDMNQVPAFTYSLMEEEEEIDHEYLTIGTRSSPLLDDHDQESGGDGNAPPRKKLRLSKEQSRLLEESFRENHTLNPKQKEALAFQLKLKPRQVEVWFQNRRARTKLKQTEMECEYLKRCFGSLTEENRRLQREVEQLRALRVGPPTILSPNSFEPLQASNLTMCPRCERVATNSGNASDKCPSAGKTANKQVHQRVLLHSRQPWAAC
ncbi:hypothetical protein C5167_005477 [Papaver somniferum]|uniref:Homeobox domain-containing protein n=1 Tax=Papaver somniferum TaxID=3469 RepID=A0A4Y7JEV3_PAPSO|nr:homeobox-leucine zipper protein HOX3-like [Papaver somniferum]RZC58175.1 hypothetical protein C5167_005477 [Papaver somniferum]